MFEGKTAKRLGLKMFHLEHPVSLTGFLDEWQLKKFESLSSECIIGINFKESKPINYCRICDELSYFYAKRSIHRMNELIKSNTFILF